MFVQFVDSFMNDSLRAALTPVRAQLLCQMRAPYQHIKIFHSHQLPAPKTAGAVEVKNLYNECIPNSLEICRKRNLHMMPQLIRNMTCYF